MREGLLGKAVVLLVASAACATACYDFTIAEWVDAGGDAATDTDTDADTDVCDPGFTGQDCDVCVRYVDADSTAAQPDGLRWHRAFVSLQPAIDSAAEAVQGALTECAVWVAEGTYNTYQSDPTDTVQLSPGVGVYGGFAGDETELYQRDWVNHETVLDGRDSASGEFHVYHVLRGADDTTVDGFTVTEGDAFQGSSPMDSKNWGGGMLNLDASPTLANCTFIDNQCFFGGAIENMASDEEAVCEPLITDCLFQNNYAGAFGGAVDNDQSTPTIHDCSFVGNSSVMGGGAINNLYATLTVTGTDFEDNST
ncbi:MAG: right-handed parallel beta-helix repeat-containing protein, partial [Deltaproteobacteria bacterium]|nr:right-handed parallel beta-helix repeat-containing protein [Deltaproteobacteria bacterium]